MSGPRFILELPAFEALEWVMGQCYGHPRETAECGPVILVVDHLPGDDESVWYDWLLLSNAEAMGRTMPQGGMETQDLEAMRRAAYDAAVDVVEDAISELGGWRERS